MKKLEFLLCLLLTAGIVLFLTISPSYIAANSARDPYREWMMPKDEDFTGIIRVWHIVGFKAHTGSLSAWLESRANALEKKHFEVFFEISAMTEEEYALRIEQGDSADIYSFPSGLIYQDGFLPLSGHEEAWRDADIKPALIKTGAYDGVQYALPFVYSGYALMVNSAYAAEHGFDYEECFTEGDGLAQAVQQMTYEGKDGTVSGISGNALIYAMQGISGEYAEYRDFTSGKASMAVGDLRSVADGVKNYENGRGTMQDAYPVTNYTDLVQYLSLDRNIPEKKIPYALEFISLVLEKNAQTTLTELNAYPAVSGIESQDLELFGIADEAYELLKDPLVPNAFLYKRYRDALEEDAYLALTGEISAQERLMDRVHELTEEGG